MKIKITKVEYKAKGKRKKPIRFTTKGNITTFDETINVQNGEDLIVKSEIVIG